MPRLRSPVRTRFLAPLLSHKLPFNLLKSPEKQVIYSFAGFFDSVKEFYCSPGSGSSCGYIGGTFLVFLLVPSFSLSQCIRFFRSCHFFRGLIVLLDALLVLIPHFHSTTGHAPFQGHPKFQQGFFSLHPIPSLFKEKMP